MEKNVKNIAGVSIVEVIIGLLIVSILLIAIVAVFPRMAGHGKQINEADQARIIAMEVIDGLQELSRMPPPGIANVCPTISSVPGFDDVVRDRTIGATTYTIKDAATMVCVPNSGFNTISVTVAWAISGKEHKVTTTGVIK